MSLGASQSLGCSNHEEEDQVRSESNYQLSKAELRRIQKEGKNSGHWTMEEKDKYFNFIEVQKSYFMRKDLRRSGKIFKLMSESIETRAADQCRSHHQKMERKYGDINNIIENLRTIPSDYSGFSPAKSSSLCQTRVNTPLVLQSQPTSPYLVNPFQQVDSPLDFLSASPEVTAVESPLFSFFDEFDPYQMPFETNEYFLI